MYGNGNGSNVGVGEHGFGAEDRNAFGNAGNIVEEEEEPEEVLTIDANKKKGLKYLSKILNRLLMKGQCRNSNEVVNLCIENVLSK